MPEGTLYLFDGYNLLHAAGARSREELVDRLTDYVALRGGLGVVVFDGAGDDATYGPLEVRFAPSADQLLERLAAERRETERVVLVSSDRAVRGTAGQEVRRVSSKEFLRELAAEAATRPRAHPSRSQIEDALDDATRARLEEWRRRRA